MGELQSWVAGVACGALFALVSLFAIDTTPAAGSVKILSPRDGALKTKPAAEVKVKVRGPGKFTAFTSHPRNVGVTRRFRRAGGVRIARLSGRDLALGANHLYVHQRRAGKLVDADEVHFTVGRKRPGAIRVSGIRPVEHGSVEVRVKPRGVGTLRARLNGRGVSRAFVRRPDTAGGKPRRPWLASLALHHGLRHGRNTIVITGFNKRNGRYERIRRTFTVTHGRPLLTGGRDVFGNRRARIPLAGRPKSAPGRTAHKLRWKIVERPRGSKAKLVGAGGGSPALIAHDTGHYTIEARASHRIRTGSTLTAPVAKDTVEATVQPPAPPEGVPIETIVSTGDPEVVVGAQTYPLGSSGCSQTGAATGWMQLVVLERDTLKCVSTETYGGFPGADLELVADLSGLTSEHLVILSGGGENGSASQKNMQDAFTDLGGPTISQRDFEAIAAGQFSLVGVPGMNAGNGRQLIGDSLDGSSPAGAITGRLQLDTQNNYAFAWPIINLPFDTRTPASTDGQNVIQVGDQIFQSGTIPQPGQAFQLVWLDAVSGATASQNNKTYPLTSTGLADFATQLENFLDDTSNRTAILVHSIGHPDLQVAIKNDPQNGARNWASVASKLAEFGANRYVFPGLDGSGGYSFVGAESLAENDGPNAGSEFAQSKTGSDTYLPGSDAARITGLLQRNEQGTLDTEVNSATPSDDPNASDFEVTPILAQPDQPFDWDFSDRPADLQISPQAIQDAQEFIVSDACDGTTLPCGGLELGGVVDPTFGIRALYWTQDFDPSTWQGAKDGFDDLRPTAARGCDTACQGAVDYLSGADAGFGGFQGLPTEFGQVARVVGYFEGGGSGSLRSALESAATQANDWFTSVSSEIISLYDPPKQAPTGPDVMGIILGVLNVQGGLASAVPLIGPELAVPSKVLSGVWQIVTSLDTTSGGLPANDPLVFNEDIKAWGSYILSVFNGQIKALSKMTDLLVSDQGRLNDAARNITIPANTTDASGNHSWQIADDSDLSNRLAASVGRYLYASMLPVPAQALLCASENPFLPAPNGNYLATLVTDSGDGLENRDLFLVNAAHDPATVLDLDQATTLFGQPPATGEPTPRGPQGFWKPTFMSEAGPAGTGGFTYAADSSPAKERLCLGSG